MAVRRSARWSAVLLTVGAVVFLLGGIAGFLNSAVVNGDNFAAHLNDIRVDEAVKQEIGQAIATAAVDAQPDLVAVQPAIEGGAAAIVGSQILDKPFTEAVRSFHEAMTQEGSESAVLMLADIGATATLALERFLPEAAGFLPEDLDITLAQIGGQQGAAATLIPLIQLIATLAWVLPTLAITLLAVGIWIAPNRRLGLVRLGWLLAIAGGILGLLTVAMAVASAAIDETTLTGAVLSAALDEFSEPLAVQFLVMVVVGGLLVAAAGALLPQIELHTYIRQSLAQMARRPASPTLAVLRGLGITLVGAAIVLMPTLAAQIGAIIVGLVVFFLGVAELDAMAERFRASDERRRAEALAARAAAGDQHQVRRRPRATWAVPVAAGTVAVAVVGIMLVPKALPQYGVLAGAADRLEGCNGSVELCDRPFDQVVIAATHNSMSAADGSGWFLAEQPKDMVSSLDDGIRGLLVDTWYGRATQSGRATTADRSLKRAEAELLGTYSPEVIGSVRRTIDRLRREPGTGPVEPYFCHTVCELGATQVLGEMRRLRAWLDANPREVVVLFIQDAVTPEDTAAVLTQAGVAELAYTHPDGAPWPTLRQMIEADQRVLVLMENESGGTEHPWLHQGFDLVQDTEYTFDTLADFTCTLKRGSPDSPLFSVNHWLASFSRLVSNAELVNAYDVLRARVDACAAERGRTPTMIAVNWYDRGDLFRVVDELNGVAHRQRLIG